MNNLLAPFYDSFFDWNTYQDLLMPVFNNSDYGKFGFVLILIPLIILTFFYRLWEPMRNQRLMWFISVIIISVIAYTATTGILYNNVEISNLIGNYSGDDGQANPDYFILQMSLISVLYSTLISLFFSFFLRKISTNNSHNPF